MGRANSNIVTLAVGFGAEVLEDIQSAANFEAASLNAFAPPTGTTIEDIQSAADFPGATLTTVDPLWADVVLLLHCDGSNGSTAFPDSSTVNNTMTAHGTAQVSTSNPKFGTGALILDTNTDDLTCPCPGSGPLDLSDTDFTIEFFIYPTRVDGTPTEFLEIGQGSGYLDGGIMFYTGNYEVMQVQMVMVGSPGVIALASAQPLNPLLANTWQHIAFVRQGNFFYLFVGGVNSSPPFPPPAGSSQLIAWAGGTFKAGAGLWTNGAVGTMYDEVRITRAARYTTNFTPPTAPFPNG